MCSGACALDEKAEITVVKRSLPTGCVEQREAVGFKHAHHLVALVKLEDLEVENICHANNGQCALPVF